METGIFYFSGTGNSLAAAKALKEYFNCSRLINIAEIVDNERIFACYDRVIAVYPSYAYGMPVAVRRFFKKAEINKGAYTAALVTYGSRQGGALAEAKRLLRRRGIKLNYARGIPAVENFLPIFGAPKAKQLAERTAMQEEAVRLICGEIDAGKERGVSAFAFSKIVSFFFRAASAFIARFYRVEDSCTGCGICQKVCPAHAVRMADGRPDFCAEKCELCQSCINWCPQKAISFLRVKPETPRYTHGAVSLKEFILQSNAAPQPQEEFAAEPVAETV